MSGGEQTDCEAHDLTGAVVAGDESALRALYERYAGLLLSVAFDALGDWQAAEEVVQDVFVQCWRRADTYDVERGSVTAWLARMARNRAIDEHRYANARKRPERASVSIDAAPPVAASSGLTDARLDIWGVNEALATLSPNERTAIVLALHGGLTQAEIADVLATPLDTVKSWIRRGTERLRARLVAMGIDYG